MQSNLQKELAYWEQELSKSKIRLVRNESPTNLIKNLNFTVEKHEVSESGAVTLKVSCGQKEQSYINGDLRAKVDGVIQIIVKSGNNTLGKATCVLPYGGVGTYSLIDCICTNANAVGKELSFEFEASNIWLIEA